MMKRRAITTKLSITKQGEVKFFQVKIPFDAIAIIGIETAMRLKRFSSFPAPTIVVRMHNPYGNIVGESNPGGAFIDGFIGGDVGTGRNSLAGELRLQSSDDSNVFYATDVSDQTSKENLDKVQSVNFIFENVWTHGYKRELEEVQVDGNTTVLAGLYKDKLGEMLKQDVSYDVFLYVWYKFKKEKQ
jgi:hypothetical protein